MKNIHECNTLEDIIEYSNYLNDKQEIKHLPNEKIRNELLKEPVKILTDEKIFTMSKEQLYSAERYYELVLENIVGEQVWDIFAAYRLIEDRLHELRK